MTSIRLETSRRRKELAKWLAKNDLQVAVFVKEEMERFNGNYLYYAGDLPGSEYSALAIDASENVIAGVDEYIYPSLKGMTEHKVVPLKKHQGAVVDFVKREVLEKYARRKVAVDLSISTEYLLSIIMHLTNSEIIRRSTELTRFVHKQRSVKSEFEIREMTRAINISFDVLRRVVESFSLGRKLGEIKQELLNLIVRESRSPSFEPDVRIRTGLEEIEVPSLSSNCLVLFDFGVRLGSMYLSDVGSTIPYRPNAIVKDFLSNVLEIKRKGLAMIKAGQRGNQVRTAIDSLISEFGLISTHRCGHQIGLNVHEPYGPALDYGIENSIRLKLGNVVTWEPGVGIPNNCLPSKRFGLAHIEDMILITAHGPKLLGDDKFELDW